MCCWRDLSGGYHVARPRPHYLQCQRSLAITNEALQTRSNSLTQRTGIFRGEGDFDHRRKIGLLKDTRGLSPSYFFTRTVNFMRSLG